MLSKKQSSKISLTEGGKDGTNKFGASNKFVEPRILGRCEDEGIGVADNVEYVGLGIRNQTKKLLNHKKRWENKDVYAENWN